MTGEFCDTNVLVYAHDLDAGSKHEQAVTLVERLWTTGEGVLSVQVLQEFFVVVTRKLSRPVPLAEARRAVEHLSAWRVFAPQPTDVLAAIDAAERWKLSFWDAMLLTAANRAGATVVWSEDLSHRQRYDHLEVHNPFQRGP
jgi:predicted nucleic acid-binding protein